MKMTVDIPADLHKKLKIKAVEDNTTIKDLIIDLLEGEFGKSKDQKNIEKIMGKRKKAIWRFSINDCIIKSILKQCNIEFINKNTIY